MKPTESQMRMLRSVERFCSPVDGWSEIEMEFRAGFAESMPARLEQSVIDRVADACKRKGWISENDYGGPVLTDAGRALLSEPPRGEVCACLDEENSGGAVRRVERDCPVHGTKER